LEPETAGQLERGMKSQASRTRRRSESIGDGMQSHRRNHFGKSFLI